MILPNQYTSQIVLYPDPILTTPCTDVDENITMAEYMWFVGEFAYIMSKYKGIGVAANQIGLSYNICAIIDQDNQSTHLFINPQLLGVSMSENSQEEDYESCLSLPNYEPIPVIRYKDITVSHFDCVSRKTTYSTLHNMNARILLHEMDHLQGKTILNPGNGWTK